MASIIHQRSYTYDPCAVQPSSAFGLWHAILHHCCIQMWGEPMSPELMPDCAPDTMLCCFALTDGFPWGPDGLLEVRGESSHVPCCMANAATGHGSCCRRLLQAVHAISSSSVCALLVQCIPCPCSTTGMCRQTTTESGRPAFLQGHQWGCARAPGVSLHASLMPSWYQQTTHFKSCGSCVGARRIILGHHCDHLACNIRLLTLCQATTCASMSLCVALCNC